MDDDTIFNDDDDDSDFRDACERANEIDDRDTLAMHGPSDDGSLHDLHELTGR